MYDRCISSSIGRGRIRRDGSCVASSGIDHLDVQVQDFLRVFLDVLPAGLDRLPHQDGEDGVRGRRVVDRDLFEEAPIRVHRGLPELLRVHLAEALVSLGHEALLGQLFHEFLPLSLRVSVMRLLPLPSLVEARLREVHIARVDQGPHVAEEQGQQQRRDVLTLFFRYMRPLIDAGYVYIAQPPLYKIRKGKETHYAYSERQREEQG